MRNAGSFKRIAIQLVKHDSGVPVTNLLQAKHGARCLSEGSFSLVRAAKAAGKGNLTWRSFPLPCSWKQVNRFDNWYQAQRVQHYAKQGNTEANTEAIQQHDEDVAKIAVRVRDFYDRGEKFRINHGSTNSTRKDALGRDPKTTVDTSALNRVLLIDTATQTALVEPNVPMDKLVEATLEYGLVPPVVMEFPGITVGGGYSGTSGESSSFKHGFFDRTLESVEIVLADGEVITCSRDNYADLLDGAAGALGTFGVTTMVKLRLRKASKYVQATYHPVNSVSEAVKTIYKLADPAGELDYVDGIMYSPTEGAIITAKMTDKLEDGMVFQRFSEPTDPWFYLHVRSRISNQRAAVTEAIPLPEYLFRYDRGGFWVGAASFQYFKGMPFNKFTRRWLDDFLHTRMLYKALHGSGQSEKMIIQDLALPYETAEEFMGFTDKRLGIWPLWLCPLKQSPSPSMHPHYGGYEADEKTLKPMLNIGLWGWAPQTQEGFLAANKHIEMKLRELRGMRWNYAQSFSSETEFWQDFDKASYDALRKNYKATSLPTVYDKVSRKDSATQSVSWKHRLLQMWPISGIYGIRKAIQSRDYLLARNAAWKKWLPRTR